MRLSAPANLLLVGEYAILEPGGLGLCLAPEVRARLDWEPAETWDAEFRFQDRVLRYRGDGPPPELLAAVGGILGPLSPARLILDTTDFSPGGRKLGLGSSAAAALLLTAAFLTQRDGARPTAPEAATVAVRVHRLFQGGRGSGYDVWCSALGGTSVFEGGEAPRAEPVTLPWLPAVALVRGPAPVATGVAVGAFQDLRHRSPDRVAGYVRHSNASIRALRQAHRFEEALPELHAAASRARALGQELGRPAEVPEGLQTFAFAKGVGAGDELFVVLDSAEALRQGGLQPLVLSTEGLRWE
ncbi:MAG: hypothetical protein QN161_12295 [Armatimonadota bacterium]|nr:hypothetical protein [Armatimonadota bacterium]